MASKYTETLDELRFSDADKAEMTDWLVAAASGEQAVQQAGEQAAEQPSFVAAATETTEAAEAGAKAPRRKRTRSFRAVAAAVAVVCVLVAGGGIAYATGGLVSLGQAFDDIFNGPPAQTEIADKIGHPIDAVATSNGITVSADAVIGDANHLAIVYSIVREDGEPFALGQLIVNDGSSTELLPCMFRTQDTDVGRDIFNGMLGSSYFYDADPTDAAIQMVEQMEFSGEGSLIGRTARVSLRDLLLIGETEAETQTLKGEWNLKFELNYEDSTTAFPSGQTFNLNGLTATVDAITVSPIAFTIKYTATPVMPSIHEPSGRESDEARAINEQYFDVGTVVFKLADGTTISQGANMGGSARHDADASHCETGFFFERIIDPDDVVAIEFCGITVTRG